MDSVSQFSKIWLLKIYYFLKKLLSMMYAIFFGLCTLVYTVCKSLIMVIGFLSILSSTQDLFDHRPFKFEYLHPVELGQAFFDLRYPISSHLSLSYVLDDLRKAGAECVERTLKNYEVERTEKGYEKAIRCVYSTGWINNPQLTDYIIVVYISERYKIREVSFNLGYVGP